MDAACRRFLVEGRVQGVGFRAATSATARDMGLRGWVRNLADGRVEVVACGPPESVNSLRLWLHEGPSAARVTAVLESAFRGEAGSGFGIA